MCHAVDRSMPSILTEPIRAEFNLADAQLGLFTGVAYGISLAIFVLPMGYFSDRVNRRNFLAVIVSSEEHTSALQSLMRTPYAVFCLKTNRNIILVVDMQQFRSSVHRATPSAYVMLTYATRPRPQK